MSTGGLGRPGVAAVKWSAVSTGARFALQLVAQVVLARTLGPDIFGVFAIGMVVLTFATFFRLRLQLEPAAAGNIERGGHPLCMDLAVDRGRADDARRVFSGSPAGRLFQGTTRTSRR
ncbi:hypothetical protein LP415_10835 [Polaromonas sp. P1(28)-8]|nr:hypothetical protein LP415_10835 [Polaromonas sp. P1(28)-8]